MQYNEKLSKIISECAEVAGYLWERGWAERNGGNISYNITEVADQAVRSLPAISEPIQIGTALTNIAGHYFLVTGTGKRMRYFCTHPMENSSIIRISEDGTNYVIVAEQPVMPTSELPSHLMMHDYLLGKGVANKAVLHTHPIELIAMTHNPKFLGKDVMSRLLWSMIPETRAFCPKGVGIVPYNLPGSLALARDTIKLLDEYDVVMWEKHGALAVGNDIIECFDMIDTLCKSALIYKAAKSMGFEPTGMTDAEMDEMKRVFNL